VQLRGVHHFFESVTPWIQSSALKQRRPGGFPRAGRSRAAKPRGLSHLKQVFKPSSTFRPTCKAERRIKRLKRFVWAFGRLHALADKGFRPSVCWFVTLTYRGEKNWRLTASARPHSAFTTGALPTAMSAAIRGLANCKAGAKSTTTSSRGFRVARDCPIGIAPLPNGARRSGRTA
jgi:hypothetical protein